MVWFSSNALIRGTFPLLNLTLHLTCISLLFLKEAGLKDPNFASSLEKANEYSMKKGKVIKEFVVIANWNCIVYDIYVFSIDR